MTTGPRGEEIYGSESVWQAQAKLRSPYDRIGKGIEVLTNKQQQQVLAYRISWWSWSSQTFVSRYEGQNV